MRSLDIYYSPIPSNKESYAIVLKVINPKDQDFINSIHLDNQRVNQFQVIWEAGLL